MPRVQNSLHFQGRRHGQHRHPLQQLHPPLPHQRKHQIFQFVPAVAVLSGQFVYP